MRRESIACVIPVIPEDYKDTGENIYMVLDKLPVDRLVFIGPETLRLRVEKDARERSKEDCVSFINENELIPFERVLDAYEKRKTEQWTQNTYA